jgi:hypothetical protein
MITVTKNPVDDSDITIVSGVIETVKITKLKTPDSYKNTHKASLKIGDDWINVGAYKSTVDSLTTQDANKNWIEVKEGQTVKFAVSPRVYQGKTYYDVKRTNIKIVNSDSVTTEAPVKNAELSKQQGNTNTAGKDEKASRVDTKRFYGVLKSIGKVDSVDGMFLLSIVELEKTTEISEPQFFFTKTDLKLQEGCRVNFKYTTEEDKNIITEVVKVYDAIQTVSQKTKVVTKSKVQDAPFGSKERQMKMTIGNMFNVAVNAVGVSDLEKTKQFAYDLYELANILRDKLIEEYQETHSDNDIGAKLGDALKAAALFEKDIMNLVVKAEEILKVQIELEKMIFNKDKNKEQDIKQEDIFSNKNEIIESKEVSVISYKSGFLEDPVDFDDDIPFAPIGLQYREILSCI